MQLQLVDYQMAQIQQNLKWSLNATCSKVSAVPVLPDMDGLTDANAFTSNITVRTMNHLIKPLFNDIKVILRSRNS